MMAAIGQYIFSLPTLAYQQMQRATDWRHPSNSRVGARPARQFVGPGEDAISLSGLQVPEFMGDLNAMSTLRAMGDAGKAYSFVLGTGEVLGAYVIESVNETGSMHIREGLPRRIEFTLELKRVDDAQADPTGGVRDPNEDFWSNFWW